MGSPHAVPPPLPVAQWGLASTVQAARASLALQPAHSVTISPLSPSRQPTSAPNAPVEGPRAGDVMSRQPAQQQADGGFARLGRPPAHPPSSSSAPPRAGMVRASVAGQAGTGIARHELALAAYLTARLIVGRPVDPEDMARLRKANDSVDETRQRLPLGRGSVIEDIDATDGDSMWRANAARSYAHHLDRRHHVPRSDLPKQTLHQAVAATAFSAGRCGEYSPTAAVLHAEARPTARLVAAFDKMLGLGYWTEPQVLDSSFVAQAQGVAAQDTLSAELAAARIAKQLGATVETQRADVAAILQALAGFKA